MIHKAPEFDLQKAYSIPKYCGLPQRTFSADFWGPEYSYNDIFTLHTLRLAGIRSGKAGKRMRRMLKDILVDDVDARLILDDLKTLVFYE